MNDSNQLSFAAFSPAPDEVAPVTAEETSPPAPTTQNLAPMLQAYVECKKQHPEHLILFQVGDFYEIFYDDARVASDVLGIRLTSRDKTNPQETPMCGVPIHAIESYVPRILEAGLSCVLVSQVEDSKAKKGMVRREITRIVTPGVRYEGDGLSEQQFNFLATAALSPRGTGALVLIDVSTGYLRIHEVETAEQLMELFERIRPAELVLPSTFAGAPVAQGEGWPRALRSRAKEQGIHLVLRPFQNSSAETLSRQFAGFGASATERGKDISERLSPDARSVVDAALRYVDEMSFGQRPVLAQCQLEERAGFVFVDAATRTNLELFESRFDGKRKNSLIDHIDCTRTAMGSRLLADWLLSPRCELGAITERHDAVEELSGDELRLEELRNILLGVRDLDRLLSRVTTGRAVPRDLRMLGDSLSDLVRFRELLGALRSPRLFAIASQFDDLRDIHDRLCGALIEEAPVRINEGGIFAEGYHEELDKLRVVATKGKEWVIELEAREKQQSGIGSLRVKYNNVFGYFIEVSKANLHKVPAHFERKQTLVNAERFVTKELKELEHSVLSARGRQVDLERELFGELRSWVCSQASRIQQTSHFLAELDVFFSFSIVARERNYCRPQMCPDNRLIIKKGRHPVIERVIGEHNFIPNDTRLDTESRRFALLTGPNMGGKSTYLRQVALIQLLAQAGSFVPAESAQLGVVDRIFTRIGAADDITRGDSTFMVEMREAACIIKRATIRSLVLIDEIGRGTATADGLAVATAIAEWLHDRTRCRTIFATHFHELVEFARTEGAFSLAVGVIEKEREIIFTHRIEERAADRSYGIEVARLAGLPEELLERALEVLRVAREQRIPEHHAAALQSELSNGGAPSRIEIERVSEAPRPDPVVERLRGLNTDQMTPLEALVALAALRSELT